MANRQLTPSELEKAHELLASIRNSLDVLSNGDRALRFAYNRKIYKELGYDERSKPAHRTKLKNLKWKLQKGCCAACYQELPIKDTILDRLNAVDGYTEENTRLLCRTCDYQIQESRKFS